MSLLILNGVRRQGGSGTESLSHYLRDQDRSSLIKACHFFGIILFFAIGAGVGGIMSKVFLVRTIWISMLLLAAVTVMMGRETIRRARETLCK